MKLPFLSLYHSRESRNTALLFSCPIGLADVTDLSRISGSTQPHIYQTYMEIPQCWKEHIPQNNMEFKLLPSGHNLPTGRADFRSHLSWLLLKFYITFYIKYIYIYVVFVVHCYCLMLVWLLLTVQQCFLEIFKQSLILINKWLIIPYHKLIIIQCYIMLIQHTYIILLYHLS